MVAPRKSPYPIRRKRKDAGAQMFTPAMQQASSTPATPAEMFAGPLQALSNRGTDFVPGASAGTPRTFDWASLAQGLGAGLLTGKNWGEGVGQGLMYARQFGEQNEEKALRAEERGLRKQKLEYDIAKDQRSEEQLAAQTEAYNAAVDALNVPPETKALLKSQGPGWAGYGDLFPKAEPLEPYSDIAKAKADLDAGLISPEDYQAFVRKETYIAPQQSQQPYSTNLITLVDPKSNQSRSVDSRDLQTINELIGQGWVERQTSMFPAAPSGYTYTPSGLAAIPGGPADPANPNNITADQRKTGSFAQRLEAASAIIDATEGAGTDYLQSGLSSVPLIGNTIISSDRQKLEQAQRDFINAQLRRESGATIQDTEFENARKQYFPQPGDSEDVLAQKKAARKLAVENMQREAGAALPQGGGGDAPPPPPGFVPLGQ